ncbi:MAG: hypothetical protein ACTHXN_10850 [Oceanisphaera sp.]
MLRKILELFRIGTMICPISQPAEYQALKGGLLEQAEAALAPYGRTIVQKDQLFYSSYLDANNKQDNKAMREQLRVIRDVLAPIIHFITLVIRTEGRSQILSPGEIIKLPNVLKSISDEAAYQHELERLSSHKGFGSHKGEPNIADRLMKVFEGLEKRGYLTLSNPDAQIYTVTGSIEHFYEVLDFIVEYEQIPLDNEQDHPSQGGLDI